MREIGHTALSARTMPPVAVANAELQYSWPALSEFLDRLYLASVDGERMHIVLDQLAGLFNASVAAFVERFGNEPFKAVAWSSRRGDLMDGDCASLQTHPGASVSTGSTMLRCGPTHWLLIGPGADKGTTGLAVLRSNGAFSEDDIAKALALLPDIRRALGLRGRTAGVRDGRGLSLPMEQNEIAILLTRNRAVERSNPAASALLAGGKPVGVRSGRLYFDDPRAQNAFEQLSRADAPDGAAFTVVLEGTRGQSWIVQIALSRASVIERGVVVALTPFSSASRTRAAMLAGFTDLTPTERQIFAAFVDGDDIAAIAGKMHRSVETVRWHVRNLFTKLGVNSQADLVRLGALLLPI